MKAKALAPLALVALCGFALVAGLYGRFHALGSRPLAVDEYYFVSSVHLILEKAIPEYALGGYYVRGLPLQYLTALSVLVLGDNGLAYRLPPVLLSLLAVFLSYRYSRCHLGRPESLAVAAAVLASSWEIEFARFARMYVPLQCAALGLLIAVHRSLSRSHGGLHWLACGLALLASLIHPLAVALLPLIFVEPLRELLVEGEEKSREGWKTLTISLLTSLLAIAYALLEPALEQTGVVDPLPADWVGGPSSSFVEPAYPFLGFASSSMGLALLAVLPLTLAVVLWSWGKPDRLERGRLCLLCLLVLTTGLHQFVLSGLLLLLLHFRFGILTLPVLSATRERALLVAAAAIALLWLGVALTHRDTLLLAAPGDWPKAFRLTFLGWPDFYQPFFEPWLRFMPLLTMFLGLSLLWQLWRAARQPLESALASPALPIAAPLLFLGIMRSYYQTTRYSFFIYPAALCLIMILLRDMGDKYTSRDRYLAPLAFLVLFAVSRDFQPVEAFAVASDEVSYRLGGFEKFRDHWFRRDDLRSVAHFLNRATNPDEPLLVSAAEHEMPFYLKRPFALCFTRQRREFVEIARRRGTRDKWSNARLLTSPGEVLDYVHGHSTVWLTRRSEAWNRPFEVEDVWGSDLEAAEVVYASRDGRVQVVRLSLRAPGENDPSLVGRALPNRLERFR